MRGELVVNLGKGEEVRSKTNARGVTLEVGRVGKETVEGSNLAAYRGRKDGCFENGKLRYVVVLQSVHMCRQYLAGGVLYEKLGFVGSYDF